jgi:hypothetical protein
MVAGIVLVAFALKTTLALVGDGPATISARSSGSARGERGHGRCGSPRRSVRSPVEPLGGLALGNQAARARLDAERPVGPARGGHLAEAEERTPPLTTGTPTRELTPQRRTALAIGPSTCEWSSRRAAPPASSTAAATLGASSGHLLPSGKPGSPRDATTTSDPSGS